MWNGICINMLQELAKSFNFTYNLIEAPDRKFGSVDENGEWNGLVRMVMDKVHILY